uniref:Mn2+ and Fe2+ transporter of the NRAMP family n=1 Tax=uncultured Flavobacteriia bacterium TaxID=212695 RepID=H6RER6_9BACT|nr:Mn2+ and Fe2+ transporter of the NRAMP family [uncultured Flavobacteriia bacterium]
MKIGKWMLALYFILTVGTMFFVTAAVGMVTAGFMENLFGIRIPMLMTTILFLLCLTILVVGKYSVLDSLIKIVGAVLLLSTVVAFILTLIHGPVNEPVFSLTSGFWTNKKDIGFLIALMGWMPTAIDLSTWNSLWTLERIKQTKYTPTMKETLFDFNLGYILSAVLSICFVTLGAYIIYGSDVPISNNKAEFANDVVNLYSYTIGSWSYFIIAAAAFSIMFGTCIAVFDGYARSLNRSIELLFLNESIRNNAKKTQLITLTILSLGAFLIILYFSNNPTGFKKLIDLATTLSFLIAPLIAIVNFKLVLQYISKKNRPKLWLQILSYLGIFFLVGFSIYFFTI